METNSNAVNIKKPYHHGDLRMALIAEGLDLLAAQDAESVSLREVARRAGVSATSVYRHFPDKQALLTALARDGLARLGAAQRAAAEAAGDGDSFAATGIAYVDFAMSNPALFRLIFTSPDLIPEMVGRAIETDPGTLLHANAAATAARTGGEAEIHAVQAWSCVHGLALLILDGHLPPDEALIRRVIAASSPP